MEGMHWERRLALAGDVLAVPLPTNALVFCYHCREAVPLRLGLWTDLQLPESDDPYMVPPIYWLLLSGVKPRTTMKAVVEELRQIVEARREPA